MIKSLSYIFLIALLLSGCSRGKVSYYERGNLHKRSFLDHVSDRKKVRGDYYEVRRNDKKQVVSAKHLSSKKKLIEKSNYIYNRQGALVQHLLVEYFENGPARISREWSYDNGRVTQREEQWFTRSHLLERKLTIHYDANQKAFLEEIWGLGNRLESSTEYYYDYEHRLDKSKRNFYLPDGSLRDYWMTIYNDNIQIINEDHYLPDNSIISFYRYSYHPVKGYREIEEILDENRGVFITRIFDEYGLILSEEEKSRDLVLIKKTVYEYNKKHQPKMIHTYNANGKLIKSSKYTKPRYLETFRTPGL